MFQNLLNLAFALFFSALSGVFEEKSLIMIETLLDKNKGIFTVFFQGVPALATFAISGFCYLIQAYFLKQAGVGAAAIAFGIWMLVVVGLLFKDSPELLKSPVNIIMFCGAFVLLGAIQLRAML